MKHGRHVCTKELTEDRLTTPDCIEADCSMRHCPDNSYKENMSRTMRRVSEAGRQDIDKVAKQGRISQSLIASLHGDCLW